MTAPRIFPVQPGYSLAQTCGPVAWSHGRWANLDWIHGALTWVGLEDGSLVHRCVAQDGAALVVSGTANSTRDREWLARTQGVDGELPTFDDPVVAALAARFPGVRIHCSGTLFDSLVTCIAGQSITVAAAAVVETRICALFHAGLDLDGRRFFPHPSAEDLAETSPALLRQTGLTWKRAEAIVAAAQAVVAGEAPDGDGLRDLGETRRWLRSLPLVGPWTAESVLLWGLGEGDAYPPGDAALLRAAKLAYGNPGLDHRALNTLAEAWRPARAWAARLLWTGLFGPAQTP